MNLDTAFEFAFESVLCTLHPSYITAALFFSQSESSNFCMYIINILIQ